MQGAWRHPGFGGLTARDVGSVCRTGVGSVQTRACMGLPQLPPPPSPGFPSWEAPRATHFLQGQWGR